LVPSFIGFIPTSFEDINGFFDLAPLSPEDVVYDLGSGDGRLLFAALEKGAGRVVGVEINPVPISIAQDLARQKGLEDRVKFLQADFMEVDLAEATVVLCYLFTSATTALKPKFERELKTGTRVVTESFAVPGWNPAKISGIRLRYFYLYVMPPSPTRPGEINYAPYDYYGYSG
jgi:ubiquinone/menaquinone biosynthesis C-methylase UbiE